MALIKMLNFFIPRKRNYCHNSWLELEMTCFSENVADGYVLQIVGAFWYLLALERNDTCWQRICKKQDGCNTSFLYCGNQNSPNYNNWSGSGMSVLLANCTAEGEDPPFDYGIFKNALLSRIVSSKKFITKYCYCLWWGLQNLR